jgi:mannose/fructose-specific phosphotransferase system component IIA
VCHYVKVKFIYGQHENVIWLCVTEDDQFEEEKELLIKELEGLAEL